MSSSSTSSSINRSRTESDSTRRDFRIDAIEHINIFGYEDR
jgi:hypothetical protein